MSSRHFTDNSSVDRSYQMRLLSVIAISFVVFGHIRFSDFRNDLTAVGTFSGWFPYYRFHLPVFLFISGYFYKGIEDAPRFGIAFGKFLLKKIRHLLLPYYVINGLFLLLGTWLRANWHITYLTPFSLEEWLIHPWTKLYSITYSVPTWYMISLFIAEIYFVLLRKLFRLIIRKDFVRELILLLVTLGLGIGAIILRNSMPPSETIMVYLRSVLMLFFIQVGIFYRRHLEKHDNLNSGWYFLILFTFQFLLILLSGNNPLSPGLFGMVYFEVIGYDYFLAGLTGIALYLRITRILATIPRQSRVIKFIGGNTKYIMAFHVFGFFLLNCFFRFLYEHNAEHILLIDFKPEVFRSYLYYACVENPRMILLYYLAGMAFSLLVAWLIGLVKRLLHSWRQGRRSGNQAEA